MTTDKKYKSIQFQIAHGRTGIKTQIWVCFGRYGSVLGYVTWYGAWREYCFFTTNESGVFNGGCLHDVQDFLSTVNAEHKAQVADRKAGA